MKRIVILSFILFLAMTSIGSKVFAVSDQTNENLLSLTENVQMAIKEKHYETAQSLLQSFQGKFNKSAQDYSYREQEALRVVTEAVSKSLEDPGHSPLIHNALAFQLVSQMIFQNDPPNIQVMKNQLLPLLDQGKKKLLNNQDDAFTATFNQWKLDINAYYPVFYLDQRTSSFSVLQEDIQAVNDDVKKVANGDHLSADFDKLEKDLKWFLTDKKNSQSIIDISMIDLLIGGFLFFLLLMLAKRLYFRKKKAYNF